MSLLSRVRGSEGLCLSAYPDPLSPLAAACRRAHVAASNYLTLPNWQGFSGAPWTIGYGHTAGVKQGDICTIDQAENWLLADLAAARASLEKALPWVTTLDQPRHDVLVDMNFNLGIGKLLGFHKALDAIRRGDWSTAAAEMLSSAWASQVGRRAVQLARIMRTGVDE